MRRLADRWWLAGLVLLLAVIAATAALLSVEHSHRLQRRHATEREAMTTLRSSVQDVLDREATLARIVGAVGSPNAARWQVLAQTVMSQPLANSTGFIVPVPGRDRAAFERRSGQRIVQYVRPGVYSPAPARGEYLVAEAVTRRGAASARVGLDLGADPLRRKLLLSAAATHRQAASRPVSLISADGARGIVIFAPVYGPGGALRGWISATYKARGLAAMVAQRVPGVGLTIRDGNSPLVGAGQPPRGQPGTVRIAGQTWQVWTSVPGAGLDAVPWLVFGLGLSLVVGVMTLLRQAVVRERYASAQVEWHVAKERARQAELAEERRALAEAQSIAHIGSWSIDPDSDETQWSEQMYRIFGRDPAEGPLLGSAFLERLHPDDQEQISLEFRRALRSGDGFDLRARLVDDDGHIRHLRALARRGPDGRFLGTMQDVTQASELRDQLAIANARLSAVLDHSPMGIYMRDLDGRFIVANQELASIQGSSADQLVGQRLEDVLEPDAAARVRASDEAIIAGRAVVRYEEMIPAAAGDDHSRTFLWQKFPVFDAEGEPLGVGGIALDMTERLAIEAALGEIHEQFRGAFEDAPIGMAILDFDGRLTRVNDALGTMLGYTRGDLEGMLARTIAHPDELAASRMEMEEMRAGLRTVYSAEKRYITATGEVVSCALQASVLTGPDGTPRAILSQIQDITDRKRHEAQLEHLADHDALTGLLNRRAFIRELNSHCERGARYGATGAVLMIDLDQFKYVNDTLGHHAGDQLITCVAQLLNERLRASDVLARLGGDEFAILLPQASPADAERVAQSVIDTLRSEPIAVAGSQRHITASIGIASCAEGDGLSAEDIMINADLAMYDAKESGRGHRETFVPGQRSDTRMQGRVSWAQRLNEAIANDGFELLAQPIVNLQTHKTTQYELLLRMRDEHGDLIPPASFLYVAERLDLMTEIDSWVTNRAIQMLVTHPDVTLEVNLSARSLGDPELLALIERELHATGVAPERLIFEVTETAALTSVPKARAFGEQLSALGCRFALDDFGAGFGSFYYLKHLVFDYVKIDGEFIRDCVANPTDRLVVQAIVDIARGMGKQTIAEFVSDDQTIALLAELGVDYGQGYHLGMPAPLSHQASAAPAHIGGR